MKRSEGRMKVAAAASVMLALSSAVSAQCLYRWKELAIEPLARTDQAMAYDQVRQEAVVFGGWRPIGSSVETVGETWTLGPGGWTLKTTTGPSARRGARMVFHEAMGVTILHGGGWNIPPMNDTYAWDGTAWTALTTGPARAMYAMAYDSARQRVVLHGGVKGADRHTWYLSGDTFELGPSGWTGASTSGPGMRMWHAMAYDKARQRTVLFGGNSGGTRFDDTWEWDGTAWEQKFPAVRPPARNGHAMVYDELSGKTLMWGGDVSQDAWEWDGTTWTQVEGGGPAALYYVSGAYDTDAQRIVVHGGEGGSSPIQSPGSTWVWERETLADLVPDGQVDFTDYLEFLNLFAIGHPRVDYNHDGTVDFADYLLFLNYFDAGC